MVVFNVENPENRAFGIGTPGLSGKLGYQFIINSFYLDFFGGIGYALTNDLFGSAEYEGNITPASVLITYGLKMGIAF